MFSYKKTTSASTTNNAERAQSLWRDRVLPVLDSIFPERDSSPELIRRMNSDVGAALLYTHNLAFNSEDPVESQENIEHLISITDRIKNQIVRFETNYSDDKKYNGITSAIKLMPELKGYISAEKQEAEAAQEKISKPRPNFG